MNKKLLLIGGGGHCSSIVSSVLALKKYEEVGIVDFSVTPVMGVPVVGRDEDLPNLKEAGWTDAFITVGSIGNTGLRRRLYQMIKELGFTVPVITDLSAIVAQDVKIGEGSFVGKGVILNSNTEIGECAIINTGAVIEHDCKIGAFAHISPGTVLCGQVRVGIDSHVGAGSVVRQQITIGNQTLVGIGSVVVQNIPDQVKAFGNPCKVVE